MKLKIAAQVIGLIGLLTLAARAQDHGHIFAGSVGTAQNDKLIFDNAADFGSSAGYIKTLTYTNGATYAGYYQGNITFAALARLPANAGPVPHAPALGSYIQVQLVSVEGPNGGAFSFWNTGATSPTYSLSNGQTGTNMWNVTSSDGSSGSDPYGHVHGRRFTLSKAGIYKVGFKLFDTSINGEGGGPIHSPSDVLFVWFQAGVNIQSVEPDFEAGHVHVRFGAQAGFSWQLEATTALASPVDWKPAGLPSVGNDYIVEVIHEGVPGEQRYYRVSGTVVVP